MKDKIYLILLAHIIVACSAHAQIINTIAGNGTMGDAGDGSPATAAALGQPWSMCTDNAGNVYIADWGNNKVRKVNTSGISSTYAGTGSAGYTGDRSAATAATLNKPTGVFTDTAGNLYICDFGNNAIRKVTPTGIITTYAGTGATGYVGDGGAATAATLYDPSGVCTDRAGNVYIADYGNERIRKVTTAGIITTLAGTGFASYSGDSGPATAAALDNPRSISVDTTGNLYIASWGDSRIRKINTSGIISTIAGNGSAGHSGDGGPATAATLNGPLGVFATASGNTVYIADNDNFVIRTIDSAGIISTFAGMPGGGFSGDGGPATAAFLYYPSGVFGDNTGNVYIADQFNNRIRKVSALALVTQTPVIANPKPNAWVYPNPVCSTLFIVSDVPVRAQISATDGRILLERADATEIPMTGLPDGVYMIRLFGKSGLLVGSCQVVKTTK